MINFLMAVVIGLVIGVIGGFVLRGRNPNALMLAPLLAVVGAVLASVAAMLLGDDGGEYGIKEVIAQIVLAAVGVAIVALLKRSSTQPAG